MKRFVLALAASFALTITSVGVAHACGMYRAPVAKPAALMMAAAKAEQAGKLRKAARLYDRASNVEKQRTVRAEAALAAGRLHQQLGRTDTARARFARAVELDGQMTDARILYGRALLSVDDVQAAEQLEVAYRALGPSLEAGPIALDLAGALTRLGQLETAERLLSAARSLGVPTAQAAAAADAIVRARATASM